MTFRSPSSGCLASDMKTSPKDRDSRTVIVVSPAITTSSQNTGALPPSFILNLPGETLLAILNSPELSEVDLANLRRACKQISPYATEVFAKRRFGTEFRLGFSIPNLIRLSQICPSALGPFTTCIHLEEVGKVPWVAKPRVQPSYSSLREIKIDHLYHAVVPTFKAIIANADQLEVFSLKAESESVYIRCERVRGRHQWPESEEFRTGNGSFPIGFRDVDMVIGKLHSSRLRKLEMLNADFSRNVFVDFLNKHKSTIEELKLQYCQLVQGRWHEVLTWIKANFSSLEHLHIEGLFTANGKKLPGRDLSFECNFCQVEVVQMSTGLKFEGRVDIEEGLDALIASIHGK
ncbi:hypothetical protein D6D29_06195 [Aureobasidium pullulans]|nr:hypothetical protein D6D29_06195 [Aureobasidium pullulans]